MNARASRFLITSFASLLSPIFCAFAQKAYVSDAAINSIRPEYEKYYNGQLGLLLHINADIVSCEGKQVNIVAYFFDNPDGYKTPNRGMIRQYTAPDGQTSTSVTVTPSNFEEEYRDVKLFLPYDALQHGNGVENYSFLVQIQLPSTHTLLAYSEDIRFHVNYERLASASTSHNSSSYQPYQSYQGQPNNDIQTPLGNISAVFYYPKRDWTYKLYPNGRIERHAFEIYNGVIKYGSEFYQEGSYSLYYSSDRRTDIVVRWDNGAIGRGYISSDGNGHSSIHLYGKVYKDRP